MPHHIGLDIGGTKIAGGVFTPDGALLNELVVSTPHDYAAFLKSCADIVQQLEQKTDHSCTVGIGIAGRIDHSLGGIGKWGGRPFLEGKALRHELGALLNREVRLANDANCMALAEVVDGAGAGFTSVVGLIIGTGVGAGFVYKGQVVEGLNGMTGDLGHLPLPYREEKDGPVVQCACGQRGCIDKTISGPALARLYTFMTGKESGAKAIADLACANDAEALRVLDQYFETVAKATVTILQSFDPDVIVVGGGLNALPGLYEEVPKRWGKYALVPHPKTQFVPARHGPMSGMRGAAWLWRED